MIEIIGLATVLALSTVTMAADTTLEQKVLSQIHDINLTEISAGKLALTSGQSDGVKKYGQHLIDDHKKADTKVMDLAKAEKLDLGKATDDPEVLQGADANKKTIDELHTLKGATFDKTFLDDMVEGHTKAITLAKQAYDSATDQGFKTFLGKLLPELQHHRDMATNLEKKGTTND